MQSLQCIKISKAKISEHVGDVDVESLAGTNHERAVVLVDDLFHRGQPLPNNVGGEGFAGALLE